MFFTDQFGGFSFNLLLVYKATSIIVVIIIIKDSHRIEQNILAKIMLLTSLQGSWNSCFHLSNQNYLFASVFYFIEL